jgi:ketosteroid isomerase-like protein
MDSLKQAFVKKDRAALEKIFREDLSYGHWNGTVETKAQAVQQIAANLADFEGLDISNATIRAYGDVALVHCTMDIHEVVNGKQNLNHLVVLQVWAKGPRGWQLVARQSVRPPVKHYLFPSGHPVWTGNRGPILLCDISGILTCLD